MMDYEGRISRLQTEIQKAELDGLLVTNLTNVRYLTGFSGTNAQLLVTAEEAVFFSDPRYRARAAATVTAAEVDIYQFNVTEVLASRAATIQRLGVEALSMTIAQRDDLAARLERELIPTKSLVEGLRRQKDGAEVDLIRQAANLADQTFLWAVERIRPGYTEKRLALDIEMHMRSSGADEVSFPPIVGSGPLSAHVHHTASDRAFEQGDFVLLDLGCRIDGYCSDLTRTVVIGPAREQQLALYDVVLEAQRRGIEAAAAAAAGPEVDAAARGFIVDRGYGEACGHGLGRGVGLDVHEAPRLNRDSDDVLLAGDVVTIEPGIYEPGVGGIRIEDCVLVTEDAPEVLGDAPKQELLEV